MGIQPHPFRLQQQSVARKAWNIYSLALYRKCLPNPDICLEVEEVERGTGGLLEKS